MKIYFFSGFVKEIAIFVCIQIKTIFKILYIIKNKYLNLFFIYYNFNIKFYMALKII